MGPVEELDCKVGSGASIVAVHPDSHTAAAGSCVVEEKDEDTEASMAGSALHRRVQLGTNDISVLVEDLLVSPWNAQHSC